MAVGWDAFNMEAIVLDACVGGRDDFGMVAGFLVGRGVSSRRGSVCFMFEE